MFESPEGIEVIKRIRANKAFISAAGVSEKLGVTCATDYEKETKKAVIFLHLYQPGNSFLEQLPLR
ncbi:unnamed protein product [marine sediment metagenome]|uniref:Uncharacterized protein n=1 Tax=marine sediment metagenome TaxID=412755 RepID=X1M9S5_9ZZZZ